MSRLSLAELFRMSPNIPTALIACVLFKVFRLKHLGSPQLIDYPARLVDVTEQEVADYLLPALHEATRALQALGFLERWTYTQDSQVMKPAVGRVFLSPDGRTSAQALVLTDDAVPTDDGMPGVRTSVCLSSGRDGEERIWTVDQARDLDNPFERFITRRPKASPADLWSTHQATLAAGDRVAPILDDDLVRRQIERDNNRSMEISIARRLHQRMD